MMFRVAAPQQCQTLFDLAQCDLFLLHPIRRQSDADTQAIDLVADCPGLMGQGALLFPPGGNRFLRRLYIAPHFMALGGNRAGGAKPTQQQRQ